MITSARLRDVLLGVVIVATVFALVVLQDRKISKPTSSDVSYVVDMMGECLLYGDTRCYKEVSKALFNDFELPALLLVFEQNEDKQAIFSRCHEVTHYLGRYEFLRTKSVPESFQSVSEVCHGGVYHGVIEGYFEHEDISLGNTEVLEEEIRNICGKRSDYKKPTVYSECVHGIGHAMMFITDGELADSLSFCDSLPEIGDRAACYGGVFMENSSSSTNLDHPSKYVLSDDPLYPCNILEEKYLSTCYSYQSSHFSLISNQNWNKVIELCYSVPEDYQWGCFNIMGSNQVGFTQDTSVRKGNCELILDELDRKSCFAGVVSALAGRFHRDFGIIVSFCSILENSYKEDCYRQAGYGMLGWLENPDELRNICGALAEEDYEAACVEAVVNRAS